MANENEQDFEVYDDGYVTVTLTLDDDTELECRVITVFDVNGTDYIAVAPVDDEGEFLPDADAFIYRYNKSGEYPEIEYIDDDEEYEAAADAFDALMDEDD